MGSRKLSLERLQRLNGQGLKKVESVLSTVQGNSVICRVQVNNFPPFTLEVKYGLVSFLYHKDTSLIHLMLHSSLLC